MSIAGVMKNSTSLKATILGIQRQFRRGFGLNRFILSIHNNPKQGIRANFNQNTNYPYGWFKITTLAFNRELLQNPKNVARFGSGWAIGRDPTNAIVTTNYYFPVTLQCECVVKFMHFDQSLLFAQQLVISGITELLGFEIQMPTSKWTVRVLLDGESVPLPYIEDLDDGSTPGSMEMTFNFTIQTKIGFNAEQAKINNYGEITADVEIDIGKDDYTPEED